jgi:preprotein translocase subunit SecF
MEFFRFKKDIPFMRHALALNIVSFITFGLAVFFLATRGLNPSIEFTGGTLLEVNYVQTADINKTRSTVDAMGFGEVQVQNFGTSHDVLIRLPVRRDVKQTEVAERVFAQLCKTESGTVGTKQYTTAQGEQVSRPSCTTADGKEPLTLARTEAVGASVGAELYENGALALAVTVLGIMAYLAVSGSLRLPASLPTCTTWSSSWASSPFSSGSSRWRCWRPSWRCWATRSTSRW